MTNRLTSGARNSASMIGNMRANHGKEVATGRAGDRHSSAGACIGPDRQLASRKARRAWCTYHTKKRAIVATEKGAGSGPSFLPDKSISRGVGLSFRLIHAWTFLSGLSSGNLAWCSNRTVERPKILRGRGKPSEVPPAPRNPASGPSDRASVFLQSQAIEEIRAVRHKRSQKQIGRAGHVIVGDDDRAGLLGHGDCVRDR